MKKWMMMTCLTLAMSSYGFASPSTTTLECLEDTQTPGRGGAFLLIAQNADGQATAILSGKQTSVKFVGTYHLVENSFFNKVYQYDLQDPSGANAQLQVSWYKQVGRGGCGRGGCVGSNAFAGIDAALNFNGNHHSFECHEKIQ